MTKPIDLGVVVVGFPDAFCLADVAIDRRQGARRHLLPIDTSILMVTKAVTGQGKASKVVEQIITCSLYLLDL